MKKITFLLLTLLLSFLGYSQTEYLDGVIVLNEGGAGRQNASASFISATNQLTNNIYGLANSGAPLGDTAQSIEMHNDVAIIVLNVSNQVKIVNNKTFELIASVDGMVNPRYVVAYNNKAYVTCWGSSFNNPGYLAVIDLTTNTLETTVELTNGPERITEVNGNIYVAHLYSDVISVFNPAVTPATVQEILVTDRPSGLAVIGTDLYVLCGLYSWLPATTPAKLFKVNTTTNTVSSSQDFTLGLKLFHMDTNGTDLFIASEDKIYTYEVGSQTFNETPIIGTNVTGAYGIYGLNVINNTIYVADAGNYSSPGKAYLYSLQGELQHTLTVGIIPNGFYKSALGPLAVDKHNKLDVKIYPNPASDVLNIQSQDELTQVEVYNIQGQRVLHATHAASINVSSLQSGVYILKAQSNKGFSTVKFIKK